MSRTTLKSSARDLLDKRQQRVFALATELVYYARERIGQRLPSHSGS